MTENWPPQSGYDPTWRPFEGQTRFVQHPSSLATAQELAWPRAYIPVDALLRGKAAFPALAPNPPAALGETASLAPMAEAAAPLPQERRARPWAPRLVFIAGLGGGVALAVLLIAFVPKMLAPAVVLKTIFTAPMLVLRAVGPSVVSTIAAAAGQPVEPSTILLTIRAGPAGAGAADQPIRAGVRGVVWSLDAEIGIPLRAGDPLAQLADCGKAFLAMPNAPSMPRGEPKVELKVGQTVLIRLPGIPPFHGIVRPSAGVAEPPDAMVIDPTGLNAASPNACPVGVAAEIEPEAQH